MSDVLTKAQRRLNMQHVKSVDTKPELMIRRTLHSKGFRYKLHTKFLPGSPDLVFPKYRVVIFVHGCFWHRHNCYKASVPSSRTDFWLNKFKENIARDQLNIQQLSNLGWRILVIWECALKGRNKISFDLLINLMTNFIKNDVSQFFEIGGNVRAD